MTGLVVAAAVASPEALAGITENAAVTSNYVWRGQTWSNDGAALQGGIDYDHSSGFYMGAWASNVEWTGKDKAGNEVDIDGVEYDLYAGIANKIGNFGYDIGYLTYNYTDENANAVKEIKLGTSYRRASFNYYLGDNGADIDNEYAYYELGLDFNLADDVALALHYGVYDPDVQGAEESEDYSVSLKRDLGGLVVAASYAEHENDEGRFFVSFSKRVKP